MSKLKDIDGLFNGRHFDREVIILCVRWNLRYKLSFRDLAEMMAERGPHDDHALGEALHAGVCQTLESVRRGGQSVVASRRDLCEDPWQMDLSLPRS
ncbi:integrase catalytic region [Caballeronia humi]|uniref:Integrase catalytic region n=1 Tax=Caballeronia humi TaxID=326474 RepID=A0A158IRR2_9BURK|nr:integrase catalytic region [Caballeronia humi]